MSLLNFPQSTFGQSRFLPAPAVLGGSKVKQQYQAGRTARKSKLLQHRHGFHNDENVDPALISDAQKKERSKEWRGEVRRKRFGNPTNVNKSSPSMVFAKATTPSKVTITPRHKAMLGLPIRVPTPRVECTDESSAITPASPDSAQLSPRKNLGLAFADEGRTCFLTDMMASMAVDRTAPTPALDATKAKTSYDVTPKKESITTTAVAAAGTATEGLASLEDGSCAPTRLDAAHFRRLCATEQAVLEGLCLEWVPKVDASGSDVLSEETKGSILAVLGQAKLLIDKRFGQFYGLCDLNEETTSRSDGLTARAADLEGFWEVIMMQVDDVKASFASLGVEISRGKVEVAELPAKCLAPRKKKSSSMKKTVKKINPALSRVQRQAGGPGAPLRGPLTPRTKAARGRLAAFRQAYKDQSQVTASVPVLTPMRASKKDKEAHGCEFLLTPVRRSTRKTPSKFRHDAMASNDLGKLLEQTDYSYKPNFALGGISASFGSPSEEDGHGSPVEHDTDSLDNSFIISAPLNPVEEEVRSSSATDATGVAALGGTIKFAEVRSGMASDLGVSSVFTPVRRSSRLEGTPNGQTCVDRVSELPESLDYGYIPNPNLC